MHAPRRTRPYLRALVFPCLGAVVSLVMFAVACRDASTPLQPTVQGPRFQIADAAHGGPNPDFFFLPPMVADPSDHADFDAGGFDAGLSPVVEICATDCLMAQPSGFPLAFGMTTGSASEVVRLVEADEHYIVNWHTNDFTVEPGGAYRVRVLVAGTELGFADVQVYANMGQAKNANTGEFIALVDGRTLPIKFRIERGAVFVIGTGGGTVLAFDGAVTLVIPADALTEGTGITVMRAAGFPADSRIVPGTVFDFGPDGLSFAEPALLTIAYDPAAVPSWGDESSLVLGHVVNGVWTVVPGSSVDVLTHTVTGSITGFSVYGLILQPVLPPPALSAPLAFSSTRDGDAEIFTLDGATLTQITSNTASDGAPDWVGGRVLYHSNESGNYEIWMVDLQGGAPVNLTNTPDANEFGPVWSPDGCRIAYVRGLGADADIWVMNADGSAQMNLTNSPGADGGPAWSPSGTAIAFHTGRDGNQEVYVMQDDGGGQTRLTHDVAMDDGSPSYSPDGGEIAFSKYLPGDEGEIWVMEADGSNPHPVTTANNTQDYGPAWSPDGSQIAFQRYLSLPSGLPDIWVVNPDGSGLGAVVTDPAADAAAVWKRPAPPEFVSEESQVTSSTAEESNPRLGHDETGDLVVYTSQTPVGDGSYIGDIYYRRWDEATKTWGAPVLVSSAATDDKFNDVSGDRIVYTAFENTTSVLGKLMLYDIGDETTTEILSEASAVHEARIEGDVVVWTQGQNGSSLVLYRDLNWAPGVTVTLGGPSPAASTVEIGSRYLVWEKVAGTQKDIAAYDRVTGAWITVSADASLDERLPTTSGNWVAWQAEDAAGHRTIRMANLAIKPVVPFTAVDDGSYVARPSYDGGLVAYESDAAGSLNIYLYRVCDGKIFQVTTQSDDQFLVNLFGDKVAYVDLRGTSLDVYASTLSFIPCSSACGTGGASQQP